MRSTLKYRGEEGGERVSKRRKTKGLNRFFFSSTRGHSTGETPTVKSAEANRCGKTAHQILQHRNVLIYVLEMTPKIMCSHFLTAVMGHKQKRGLRRLSLS